MRWLPIVSTRRRTKAAVAPAIVLGLQAVTHVAGAATTPAPPPPQASMSVTLEHRSYHRGHVTIEIPHLEARETSLTGPDLDAILDPSSALTASQRLAKLSAASIVVPAIIIRPDPKAGEQADQVVTLHDIELLDVRAGKAASVTIRTMDGTLRTNPGEHAAVSTGAIVAHAVDPTLALAIVTGKRTDASLPVSPIYNDVSVSSPMLKDDDGTTLALDRLESGAFEGRPLLETPSDLAALVDQATATADTPEKRRFGAALLDAATSFKLDRFQASGFSADVKGREPFTFKLRSFLVQGLESMRVALLSIDDVSFDAKAAQVSFRSASMSNLDRSALFGAVMARMMGLTVPTAKDASDITTAQTEFKLDTLHVAIPTTDVDSPFPPGTVNVIDVPAFVTGEGASKGGTEVENHSHLEVRYDMPPGGSDPNLKALRDAGLAHLDVRFDTRVAYDTTARDLRLDEIALDAANLGGITLSGRVGDLPQSPLGMGETSDAMKKELAKATFRDLKLTVTDRGIIGSALPVIATQSGTAPALFKAGLKTQIDIQIPALLGHTPAASKVAAAIDSLFDGPGTLVLAFHAPHGITFNDLANADDPTDIMRRLEVTAETHH